MKLLKKVGAVLALIIACIGIYSFFAPPPRDTAAVREANIKRVEAEKLAAEQAESLRANQEKAAFVTLYNNDHFKGTQITFKFGEDNENFHRVVKTDFDDRASSANWNVPSGWQAVLYGDNTYK